MGHPRDTNVSKVIWHRRISQLGILALTLGLWSRENFMCMWARHPEISVSRVIWTMAWKHLTLISSCSEFIWTQSFITFEISRVCFCKVMQEVSMDEHELRCEACEATASS